MGSKWSYFLDSLFEKGTGVMGYDLTPTDKLGRKALARHCGRWMRKLKKYQVVEETGRHSRIQGGYYCEKCHFLASNMGSSY